MATGRPSPIGAHPAGIARHFPERIGGHTTLDEHLPVDHGLSKVYRVGAGLTGLVLVAFGILGLIDKIGFFATGDNTVAGLNTNGALSVLSIAIGVLLFVGMVIGGNFASTLNIVLGVLFLLSGFVNLALLEREFNPLAFRLQNVLFSFVVGLMLMWFGMYGRVSSKLPHDNPYWRARHPDLAEREDRARASGTTTRHRAVERGAGGTAEATQGAVQGRPEGEERGERAGQPPGKWGKLDRPAESGGERKQAAGDDGGSRDSGSHESGSRADQPPGKWGKMDHPDDRSGDPSAGEHHRPRRRLRDRFSRGDGPA
ncbi:DUF4383 domain-containing protein [Streptomyces sp. NEAU-Y11]|uniref:DUF4383 domain-containing protein n=1 Tax=Streptomyces cucumeris TaxID=2962890 RepID=UPI0020C835D7|nr:DUF4383 domain-containing protein [Streptomyces sp. NEAU-Y11]